MNKVVSINLNGFIFNIDELAYEKLKDYLDGLRRHFQGTAGSAEIISDIETRIAELLQMKLSDKYTVIQLTDVEEVILLMGDPRQMDGEEQQEEQENSRYTAPANGPKKFRRDPRNKVIGGVCSGMANYMDIDPIVPRAIFLISFFVFGSGLLVYLILWGVLPKATPGESADLRNAQGKRLFRDPEDRTIGGVCSGIASYLGVDNVWIRIAFLVAFFVFGSGLLLYLILWIAVPKARTSAEKLQMKGEPIDVSNIERKVKETFSGSAEHVRKNMTYADQNIRKGMSAAGRGVEMTGQALHLLLNAAGKILGFVFILIAVAMILGLCAILAGGAKIPHVMETLHVFAGSGFVFFPASTGITLLLLAITLMFLLTGIKLLFSLKLKMRIINLALSTMCFIGILLVIYSGVSYAMTVDEEETVTEKVASFEAPDTIYLDVNDKWQDTGDEKTHDITIDMNNRSEGCTIRMIDDVGMLISSSRLLIKPATGDSIQVLLAKGARGATDAEAMAAARDIDFAVHAEGGRISFDPGVLVAKDQDYKFQRASVKMKIPVGTIVKADAKVLQMINRGRHHREHFDLGETFRMTSKGLVCLDCTDKDEENWEEDRDIHINIDGEEDNEDVKIHISTDSDQKEGVTIKTETTEDGGKVRVKKEIKKVGPVTIEKTEKEEQ